MIGVEATKEERKKARLVRKRQGQVIADGATREGEEKKKEARQVWLAKLWQR